MFLEYKIMAAIAMEHFSIVEYIQNMRKANFTESQAEALAKEAEQLVITVLEQTRHEAKEIIDNKELPTKGDIREAKEELYKEIKKLELKIEQYRYESLKFTIWTGVGVSIFLLSSLSGVIYSLLKLMFH